MHGHTFCGNPLGAAVAREVLAVYREEHVLSGLASRSSQIADAFDRMAAIEGVRRVRTLGMIGALDVGDGGYAGQVGWRVFEAALERGIFLRPLGDTVYVTPPLVMEPSLLGHMLDGLRDAISEVLS